MISPDDAESGLASPRAEFLSHADICHGGQLAVYINQRHPLAHPWQYTLLLEQLLELFALPMTFGRKSLTPGKT